MIIIDPFADEMTQVTFPEHDEVIQTLVLDTLHPGFGERI